MPNSVQYNKYVNPFAPGDFAEKRVLKLVEWFSSHCHAIRSYNLSQLITSWPSDPDAKYQLAKFGHAQKAKFRDVFGFKSDTTVLTFTFHFLSPLFFTFHA